MANRIMVLDLLDKVNFTFTQLKTTEVTALKFQVSPSGKLQIKGLPVVRVYHLPWVEWHHANQTERHVFLVDW